MNFFGALFAWIAIAAVLIFAVVLAVKWGVLGMLCLVAALLAFTFAFAKYGCLTH